VTLRVLRLLWLLGGCEWRNRPLPLCNGFACSGPHFRPCTHPVPAKAASKNGLKGRSAGRLSAAVSPTDIFFPRRPGLIRRPRRPRLLWLLGPVSDPRRPNLWRNHYGGGGRPENDPAGTETALAFWAPRHVQWTVTGPISELDRPCSIESATRAMQTTRSGQSYGRPC